MSERCPHGRWPRYDACRNCRREAEAKETAAKLATERLWFVQHGHCGQCGNPGHYCTCTDKQPCGCADLHPVGSALAPDALDTFAAEPVTVTDDQEAMFDV